MKIGRYEVIRRLASGGMAEVFLAKVAGPMGFEKTLVLKRILPHLAEEPDFVEMFLSEAKLVAQLNHPNIVQIFDFGEADGAYYLAMEFVDGPNLRVLLKRTGALGALLEPQLCAKMISASCEGLAFAHEFRDPATGHALGLIHRDISPDNILLSRQGAVKVTDFGIAKAVGYGPRTQSGVVKGKLAYMAPEQLRGQPLDPRADVYSLGVVLYELLTNHKPFDATTDAAIVAAILFEPLIPAIKRRPDLPGAVQRILDRGLAKDRNERYPSCLAFQAELERFIVSLGEPIGALDIARFINQLDSQAESPRPLSLDIAPPRRQELDAPTVATNALRSQTRGKAVSLKSPQKGIAQPPESLDETALFERGLHARKRWFLMSLAGTMLLFLGGGGYIIMSNKPHPTPERSGRVPAPEAMLPVHVELPSAEAEPAPELDGMKPVPVLVPSPEVSIAEAGSSPPLLQPSISPPPLPVQKPTPVRPKPLSRSVEAKPVVLGKSLVEFRVLPYATVILDGKELGTTPLPAVEVLEGRHTIRLINRELGKDTSHTFRVKAGKPYVFKLNLEKD